MQSTGNKNDNSIPNKFSQATVSPTRFSSYHARACIRLPCALASSAGKDGSSTYTDAYSCTGPYRTDWPYRTHWPDRTDWPCRN